MSIMEQVNDRDCIVCPHCGCVNDWATEQLALLERDLRAKRFQIDRLQGERLKSPRAHVHYAEAMEVLEYWRRLCAPRTRGLEGKRLTCLLARFDEGYGKGDLMLSVFGYSRRPYVTSCGRTVNGAPWERRVDASLIFRDAYHVDQGLALAESVDANDPERPLRPVDHLQMALGL